MPKIRIDEADALTVDGDGILLGVVAVTGDMQSFCGTASDTG